MSRYLDLLKQIPPGNEETSEHLLKQLNIAASNLLSNQTVDFPDGEKRDDYLYEGQISERYDLVRADYDSPEIDNRIGRWGLLKEWPLDLGDLAIFRDTNNSNYWYLGICFGLNPYVMFERGSKDKIAKRAEQLNEYRESEGEEAFEEEIMYLIDLYMEGRNG